MLSLLITKYDIKWLRLELFTYQLRKGYVGFNGMTNKLKVLVEESDHVIDRQGINSLWQEIYNEFANIIDQVANGQSFISGKMLEGRIGDDEFPPWFNDDEIRKKYNITSEGIYLRDNYNANSKV